MEWSAWEYMDPGRERFEACLWWLHGVRPMRPMLLNGAGLVSEAPVPQPASQGERHVLHWNVPVADAPWRGALARTAAQRTLSLASSSCTRRAEAAFCCSSKRSRSFTRPRACTKPSQHQLSQHQLRPDQIKRG